MWPRRGHGGLEDRCRSSRPAPLWLAASVVLRVQSNMTDEKVGGVVDALERTYGTPRHGNPHDPLDDLIYIKLSQQTNAVKFGRVFQGLKARGWCWVLQASLEDVASELRYIGLQAQRAAQLRAMLARILADRGVLDLSWLRSVPPSDAVDYLTSLPGVGVKTAYCVAMYTLGIPVLPVDTHVGRVSARLGLIGESREYKGRGVHKALEEVIPPDKRYSFHVNAVAHGRAICLTSRPRCRDCVVQQYCDFYKA